MHSRLQKLIIENENNSESIETIVNAVKEQAESRGVDVDFDGNDFYYTYTTEQQDADWHLGEGSHETIEGEAVSELRMMNPDLF